MIHLYEFKGKRHILRPAQYVRQHGQRDMKHADHLPSQPPASRGVRPLIWLRRHPEIFIGLLIGVVLSAVFLLVLKHEIDHGLIWLVHELLAFLQAMLQALDIGTKG